MTTVLICDAKQVREGTLSEIQIATHRAPKMNSVMIRFFPFQPEGFRSGFRSPIGLKLFGSNLKVGNDNKLI